MGFGLGAAVCLHALPLPVCARARCCLAARSYQHRSKALPLHKRLSQSWQHEQIPGFVLRIPGLLYRRIICPVSAIPPSTSICTGTTTIATGAALKPKHLAFTFTVRSTLVCGLEVFYNRLGRNCDSQNSTFFEHRETFRRSPSCSLTSFCSSRVLYPLSRCDAARAQRGTYPQHSQRNQS